MKKKFSDAFHGIALSLQHKSILLQCFLGLLAVIAGFVLHLTTNEWVAVILAIGLVISTEVLNTCIEKLCDLYSTETREDIRTIKDLAAGAVLFASIAALIVALVILCNHI